MGIEGRADISRLNYAIEALSDDADDLHQLITRSTSELEKTNDSSRDVLAQCVSLSETFGQATREFCEDLNTSARNFDLAIGKNAREVEDLISQARKDMEESASLIESKFADVATGLNEQLSANEKQVNEFCLKGDRNIAEERKILESMRDAMQGDLLSHKTAMAARMDSLEGEVTKLSAKVAEQTNDLSTQIAAIKTQQKTIMGIAAALVVLQVIAIAISFIG